MPRTMWSGAISFGLISIPVKLFSATNSQEHPFQPDRLARAVPG